MRYVIVCSIEGDAMQFHEKLVTEITEQFGVRRQKLPAHITLKAPFETERIEEMLPLIEEFTHFYRSTPIKIEGFNHFRNDVVFMDVKFSEAALSVYWDLISKLKTISWLEWKSNDGKGKSFHCTLVSKHIQPKFNRIWDYVSSKQCNFDTSFNNVSIYKWESETWILDKVYKLE